jgi:hypothetical protein
MPYKGSRWIRLVCTTLWIFITGILYYQNHMLQAIVDNMQRAQFGILNKEGYMSGSPDEIAMELRALLAENATYRLDLKREHINLKECMAKLPQNEIDDFYRRHREELGRAMGAK